MFLHYFGENDRLFDTNRANDYDHKNLYNISAVIKACTVLPSIVKLKLFVPRLNPASGLPDRQAMPQRS